MKLSSLVISLESLSVPLSPCSYESLILPCQIMQEGEHLLPDTSLNELFSCRTSNIDLNLLGLRKALKCCIP